MALLRLPSMRAARTDSRVSSNPMRHSSRASADSVTRSSGALMSPSARCSNCCEATDSSAVMRSRGTSRKRWSWYETLPL